MNSVMPRNKNGNVNGCWEPCATSTPLKPTKNRGKVSTATLNQFRTDIENLNFVGLNQPSRNILNPLQRKASDSKIIPAKKVKKNKSVVQFDLSSSSDEDSSSESKKRPIIKCSSASTTKSLLTSKNIIQHEIENESGVEVSITKKTTYSKIKASMGCSSKKIETQRSQSISKNSKIGSIFEKSSCKSQNSQTVPDNPCAELDMKEEVQIPSENKENTDTEEQPTESNKTTEGKLKKKLRVVKLVEKREVRSKCVTTKKKSVLSNSIRNKSSTKVTRKTREKKTISTVGTPLCLFNTKANDSHQLFSDTKEQEAINSLDLTSDSINDILVTSQYSLPTKVNHPPESAYKKVPNKITKAKKKKAAQKLEEPKAVESSDAEKIIETHIPEIDLKKLIDKDKTFQQKSLRIATLKKNLVQENKNKTALENNVINDTVNVSDSLEPNVTEPITNVKANATALPACIRLNKLAFENNQAGGLVEKCWSTKNFKCGVIKLITGSELKWKTSIHLTLGCVLTKGEAKMIIGAKKCNLNEGDMALIPPATKFHAINVGNNECIIHYWCGNFYR